MLIWVQGYNVGKSLTEMNKHPQLLVHSYGSAELHLHRTPNFDRGVLRPRLSVTVMRHSFFTAKLW